MQIEPFKLERYFARYEFKAPYLLCCSDCEAMSISELLEIAPEGREGLQGVWLGYTESPGDPALRHEIAGLYDGIDPDQILVHSGAEEAIFNTMNALLTPGDHVIVQYPCYQSLVEVARAIGCEVTYWKLEDNQGWKMDFDFLEDRLQENTRMVIVNTPHNPTGHLFSFDEQKRLNHLSQKHGFVVFSDEVYRLLEYDSNNRLPSICEINDRGLALGVMSKAFGLAGLRIGWLVIRDEKMYTRIAAYKDYTTICNSAPSEYLATIALRNRDKILERNLSIIRRNLDLLTAFFERTSSLFSWHKPLAGPIAFPRLNRGDVETFCRDVVSEAGVLLLPGTLYDNEYNHFRIGYGRASMEASLTKLEEYLQSKGFSS